MYDKAFEVLVNLLYKLFFSKEAKIRKIKRETTDKLKELENAIKGYGDPSRPLRDVFISD